MSTQQKWLAGSVLIVLALFIFLLKSILFPFIAGTALAYLGNPLVKKLKHRKMGRGLAVVLVFLIAAFVLLLFLFIVIPLIGEQIKTVIAQLPTWGTWLQHKLGPLLEHYLGIKPDIFNLNELSSQLASQWKQTGNILSHLSHSIKASGFALVHLIINIALTPVVAFYLLRDWNKVTKNLWDLLPRNAVAPTLLIASECNVVLSGFIKGQLLVMLALAIVYSVGLSIAGLQFALLIGLLAGLASIVPYLGFFSGLCLALAASAFQFTSWSPFAGILIVFAIGHVLESMILSPWLVGDRIGLHPVAVIFAVMAGEQLFGFTGIIVALPVAAIIKVLLVHLHKGYKNSTLYNVSHKR